MICLLGEKLSLFSEKKEKEKKKLERKTCRKGKQMNSKDPIISEITVAL